MKKKEVFGILLREPRGGWIVSNWRVCRPELDLTTCTKCMFCYNYCPEKAIEKTDENPRIDLRFCKGCGICATECPKGAIKMIEEKTAKG